MKPTNQVYKRRGNRISNRVYFCLSLLSALLISFPLDCLAQAPAKNIDPTKIYIVDETDEDSNSSNRLEAGTSSTTLNAGTESTTLEAGTNSTTLQGGTGSTTLQGGTAGTMIKARAVKKEDPITIMFLLDCSLSMKEKFKRGEHKEKIQKVDAAKQVMQKALMRIPTNVKLGLRVFGQIGGIGPWACRATALLVPPGTGNRGAIIRRVRKLRPTGMTPLEYALHQTAENDLRRIKGRKTVILITDGVDTCGGDPCSYIKTLKMRGISLRVDVVGLDIRRDNAKGKLDCIAKNSGGKYYGADTAAKLIESVSRSVSRAISGQVIINPEHNKEIKNPETPPELIPILPMDTFDHKKKDASKK